MCNTEHACPVALVLLYVYMYDVDEMGENSAPSKLGQSWHFVVTVFLGKNNVETDLGANSRSSDWSVGENLKK